jgi:hypothetical protein
LQEHSQHLQSISTYALTGSGAHWTQLTTNWIQLSFSSSQNTEGDATPAHAHSWFSYQLNTAILSKAQPKH